MIHLYDRDTIARALTLNLDTRLRELLDARIAALNTEYGDLTDFTEFLIVEPGDTEADVVRHVGFSPLVDPIDGHRWPDPRFKPGWDILCDRGEWFELVVTLGRRSPTSSFFKMPTASRQSFFACAEILPTREPRDWESIMSAASRKRVQAAEPG